MTLADILSALPLDIEYARQYALVFSEELAQRLQEIQATTPSQHVASPRPLTDGRHMLSADLLTEVGPGGLYATGFSKMDAGRFNEIELIPWEDALALRPPPPPESD